MDETKGVTMRPVTTNVSVCFALVAAAAMLLAGCGEGDDDATIERGSGNIRVVSLEDAPAVPQVVDDTRILGLQALASRPGETLVTSPASTVIALSMLGTGASGPAEEELSLLIGASGEDRDSAVNALVATLDPYLADPSDIDPDELPDQPQLHVANQAVIDDSASIEQSYLDNLVTWFDAGVLHADLAGAAGKKALDQWIETNTAGLIKESAIEPSEDLRLVLQNAILFAAPWTTPFDADSTYSDEFTKDDGTTVSAEFMHDERQAQYAEHDGWKMIRMSYGTEGDLSAEYVLPPAGTGLEEITSADIAALEKQLSSESVRITIPKLDLSSSLELVPALQKAGLHSVFEPGASALEHISASDDLYVSQVTQQGKFVLDEEGTVAAVTTEIGMESAAAPDPVKPKEFTADRPHLIVIQDTEVGWDLFQIAANDPTAE